MLVHQIVHCKTNVLTLINLVSTLNSGIFASTPLLALRTVPGLWFRKGFQFKTVQVKTLIGAIIIVTANHLAMFSSSAITDGYRWPITAASFSCLVCRRVFWAHCPLWGWCWSREPPANKLWQNAPQEKFFSFRDILIAKVLVWENSLNKESLFCPNDKINEFQNRWTEELQLGLVIVLMIPLQAISSSCFFQAKCFVLCCSRDVIIFMTEGTLSLTSTSTTAFTSHQPIWRCSKKRMLSA